ncbi:5-methyltetrahydropteroyltriglutamate--homocysteine methyltransferase [Actinomycetospora sp. NBRC 106375]|uniref:cobalamin-independent methionine synthase II family protein n=1 Tax=Actinomycetospora sp. NBRC 106375 TaxID=3032207 RepID=UPI0024A17FD4|nr:cobalamin-independent methionine synthase II family protein [Actinomycetospora sp. NBRC 106375]GLZ50138.1 5-methyltetrahydropteroyltriglutamate--homocysteine methyltransferase [Actinomycetospora sp. NBRC 106375]
MTGYDPKQATGIPTEQVGSLPRPQKLQDAFAAYDRGEIGKEQLEAAQDEAVKNSIAGQEAAGSPIVSDGEQRWSSFATYPITDTLAGTGLADNLSGEGGQFFAIFADGHGRQLPRLTGGPFRYKTYAADTLKKSAGYTDKPMKQAVIAPSMLYLLYPLEGEVPGYPKEQFERDLADECERDIRKAFEAGASRVSIDFTEGRLATRNDPRNPWTGAGLLDRFVEINNWVLDRFTPEERANIGVHTCPGGDRDSVHSADVPYNNLLPKMFQMNAGYFLIQLASEREKDPVYQSIGENIRTDANGVAQTAFVGVINPLNPRVESPEEVRDALVRAANFIPREQLGATDDCGFSPFSIDEKPSHGSPDFARDIAFQKIHNRVEGVRAAAEKLGV